MGDGHASTPATLGEYRSKERAGKFKRTGLHALVPRELESPHAVVLAFVPFAGIFAAVNPDVGPAALPKHVLPFAGVEVSVGVLVQA